MDILFLLVPISVVLVFLAGAAFWLALRGGQFDDLEGPGLKVIADDDRPIDTTQGRPRSADSAVTMQAAANGKGVRQREHRV